MDAHSPIPVITATAIALLTCTILGRVFALKLPDGRFGSIDGLRGYLGFGVYLHHAAIWYSFARTGEWLPVPSHLYDHLGQTSVYLFFSITGFLFTTKVIKDGPNIDWLKLYVSRILRLVPLYICAIFAMATVVGTMTGWHLRTSPGTLLFGLTKWLMFSGADLNGMASSGIILARVTWTLQYEWAFYLMLPLLAIPFARTRWQWVLMGLAGVGYAILFRLNAIAAVPFVGGITAAFLIKSEALRAFAGTVYASFLVAALFIATVVIFPTPYTPIPILMLSTAFIFISGGNTLFGFFRIKAAKILGELTYSIYLLHGILLYCAVHFVIGINRVAHATPVEYWSGILILTPILITLTLFTFKFVETPPLARTQQLVNFLRRQRFKAT